MAYCQPPASDASLLLAFLSRLQGKRVRDAIVFTVLQAGRIERDFPATAFPLFHCHFYRKVIPGKNAASN